MEGSCRRINVDFDTFDREESLKIFCTTCKQKFEKKFEERKTKFYEVILPLGMVKKVGQLLGDPSLDWFTQPTVPFFITMSIQFGAANCSKFFGDCFLKVALVCLGSVAAAVQPTGLCNS